MILYNTDRISKIDKVANPTNGGVAILTADGSFIDTGVLFSDIPRLSGGKLDPLVLPPLGISEVFVVADIAARDALTVQSGDVAKVTDADGAGHPQTYIHDGSIWIDIQETSDVISVNGKTQTVVLNTDDISEGSTNLYYTEARVTANSTVAANAQKLATIENNAKDDQLASEVPVTLVPSSYTATLPFVEDHLSGLDQAVGGILGLINGLTAADIDYSNGASGLTATGVQAAIDELSVGINNASNTISNISSTDVSYDNTASGLTAINAQQAVDEVESRLDTAESTLEFFKANGTAGNPAMADGTGSLAIGENSFVDSSCIKGMAIGWQAYVDASADSGIALGNEALAEEAINPIAIGTSANSSADNAAQIGSGANSTANTLKYRNLFVANQNSLMTLATVTNYAPAAANEIDSHLQAIDSKFGTVDTAVAAREVALTVGAEQTANFTSTVGNLEPVNSTNSAIVVAPPPTPVVGDKFAVVDSRANSAVNNISVDFAGASQLLYGASDNFIFNEDGSYAEFKFLGGAIGWIVQK